MRSLVADLRAEQATLDTLLAGRPDEDWLRATPAAGWNVRDQISHLAAVDELGVACLSGEGDRQLAELRTLRPEDATRSQCDRGLGYPGAEVLAWWRASREQLNSAFLSAPATKQVPWGAGPMTARSFASARLMECWAHGLDCFAALQETEVDTPRLWHVCRLGYRALPYAFGAAGRSMPAPLDDLRLELTGPHGETWSFGDEGARQVITGTAGQWARVAVQRMHPTQAGTLRPHGPLAEAALAVARAYV